MQARALLALAPVAFLAACATVPAEPEVFNAAAQTYRAKGAERLSTINGKMMRTGNAHRLVVTVDGVTAVDGAIGTGEADISSQYEGRPTQALCTRKDNYRTSYIGFKPYTYLASYDVTCRVIIDSEFVATLKF